MPPSQPRHRGRKFCTDRGAAYSLDSIFPLGYIEFVADVLFTGEFETWWDGLSVEEQDSIDRVVWMLAEEGAALRFPYSSKIESSAYSHMRELRIQYQGRPYRVLYAFNPHRNALLLIGGDKTGNDRWYEVFVPIADRLYKEHLKELEES